MVTATTKTVCIVGAGPSGLVAAKYLLQAKQRSGVAFQVTIFEAQPHIGGLWPSNRDEHGDGGSSGGLIHPQMLANQSRHTVQFSDLAWCSFDSEEKTGNEGAENSIAEFPQAWQIGHYLERYRQRYCSEADVRLNRRVVRAEPEERDGSRKWHLWTQTAEGEGGGAAENNASDAGLFDYLLVASGYFGSPAVPEAVATAAETAEIPVVHSSQYRDLQTLLLEKEGQAENSDLGPAAAEALPKKILVVGGQFSGVEIAGTLANHLSSAANSPEPSPVAHPELYTVHHLIQRPAWILPTFTPTPSSSSSAPPPFLPFDLNSYNLRRRPQPLKNTQGHISVDAARITHGIFKTLLGTDQSDVSPAVAVNADADLDEPPYIGVSDTYMEHVRSGLITVSRGRLESVEDGTVNIVTPSETGMAESLPDVAAVILATGFRPSTSLSFLPSSVLQQLSFDASDLRQSVALAFHGTHHPAVPGLAFVGFYRSPYWGVMEMQARLAVELFVADAGTAAGYGSGGTTNTAWPSLLLPTRLKEALAHDQSVERTLELRHDPRASQFPMGNYLFLMDAFAQALGLERQKLEPEAPLAPPMDIVTPSVYVDATTLATAAAEVDRSLQHTRTVALDGLTRGRFVARAVFRSLQGRWRLERDLVSRLPSHPSGRFVGTAEFRLRQATADGLSAGAGASPDNVLEYLYVEDGTFTAQPTTGSSSSFSFRATRRYVWRYDIITDRLSVWFVRTDDNRRADYLFHVLQFETGKEAENATAVSPPWYAKAEHLCIQDLYNVQYEFFFSGVSLSRWRLQYGVTGPKKDYSIDGTYRRE